MEECESSLLGERSRFAASGHLGEKGGSTLDLTGAAISQPHLGALVGQTVSVWKDPRSDLERKVHDNVLIQRLHYRGFLGRRNWVDAHSPAPLSEWQTSQNFRPSMMCQTKITKRLAALLTFYSSKLDTVTGTLKLPSFDP